MSNQNHKFTGNINAESVGTKGKFQRLQNLLVELEHKSRTNQSISAELKCTLVGHEDQNCSDPTASDEIRPTPSYLDTCIDIVENCHKAMDDAISNINKLHGHLE